MIGKIKQAFKILLSLAVIGAVAAAVVYLTGGSLCVVYNLFGIPCISCGMTRAWLSALQGGFATALAYHPLFWSVTLLPLLATGTKHHRLTNIAAGGLVAAFFVTWLIRMVMMFPHTPPMTVNNQAVIFKIIRGL